ncbi:MAG: hypothetical protein R3282_08075, partial [Rhodothermales bacterium]|nr:hypothetical protein [Rhodothermales bacterium]
MTWATKHEKVIEIKASYLLSAMLLAVAIVGGARAQDTFDPSWYDPARPYVKVGTTEDRIYALTGADLAAAGIPISSIDPASIQLLYKGSEVPIHTSAPGPSLQSTDSLRFVGFRNGGSDEDYLYNYNSSFRSSRYNSLFSDTTWFWLSWGTETGMRYAPFTVPSNPQLVATFTDILHL